MVKSTFLASLALLLLASAVYAALDEVCKGTPDAAFCATLLKPSEAEFADKNPKKMNTAAVKAAQERVNGVQAFMEGPEAKGAKSREVKEAVSECVEHVGQCPLELALSRINDETGGDDLGPKKVPPQVIVSRFAAISSNEMLMCVTALKKCEGAAKTAGGGDAEVVTKGIKLAEEASLACTIAQSIIVKK